MSLLLLFIICELIGDLLVGTLDAGGQDLRRRVSLDQDSLTDGDHAAGGLRVDVGQGQSDVEGHVRLHNRLVGLIDSQEVFFDVVSYLLSN